jgi:methylenetetrahydrofolate dehydrogenase (NADP+)/methenyltetrahydrofolate cyclohydrolase
VQQHLKQQILRKNPQNRRKNKMAQIIDGKKISAEIRAEIAAEVREMKAEGINPGLAVIIVGENPASQVYVRNKGKACEEVGIYSEIIEMPEATSEEALLAKIAELNERKEISGILVQLPLPKHINEAAVIAAISPDKDVDAFSEVNVGKIMIGNHRFLPCTPAGVMELITRSGLSIEGKNAVVIGRSNIVGKPQAMLLLHANATVTICHSRTKNLAEVCRTADILVVAIGKADFVTADMVKPGAVVIDVGMNRKANGKLTGDVDYAGVSEVAGYITPVPGGVGPMTITMLLKNTLTAAREQNA